MSGPEIHYSIDTSAMIDGLERYYPLANFPALWERVDDLIKAGRLHVSEEAWTEAISVDSVVKDWCTEAGASRDACVVPTDSAVASVAGAIVSAFPKWAQQGRRNNADPFVIAVAECHGYQVISGETNGGPGRPKIPYVCLQRGILHGRFVDVVRNEGWIFA